MFKIMYRITEDIKYIKSLDKNTFDNKGDFEGFFLLNFNGNIYGYYHNNPLSVNECGWELLTNWFAKLLETYLELKEKKYVALNDTESFNTWLEFINNSNALVVSIIDAEKNDGICEIQTKPIKLYKYGEWSNVEIGLEEFKIELLLKTSQYMGEIFNINPKLSKSQRLLKLNNIFVKVKNS